ncbi:MAG: M56 family metallopeptidase [Acidimicrobiia bacterium]|nr:M56 family metallopeptidase [Acidimicrobiia bacterium]
MIIMALLGAGLIAVGLPGLARRPGGRVGPACWARSALAVQLTGLVVFEAALALWAAPALLDLAGATDLATVCRRMIGTGPGGAVGGVAAAMLALILAAAGGAGWWSVVRTQRRLRIEHCVGGHYTRNGCELVVLPSPIPAAYTVGGRPPQVVLTQGLVDRVGAAGLEAVWAHESVHANRAHHRYLAGTAATNAAFRWYPPASRAGRLIRLALERWADEDAAATLSGGRATILETLLTVTTRSPTPQVAAFGAAETIAARIHALAAPPPDQPPIWRILGYVLAGTLVLALLAPTLWTGGMSILALTNPGLCLV